MMEANASVRRFDELGRILVPKEIRRQLNLGPLCENVPCEVFVRDGEIIIRPIDSLERVLAAASAVLDLIKDENFPLDGKELSDLKRDAKKTIADITIAIDKRHSK